jgi:predicted Fe-Mo cluster-binding NifX family protein
MAFGHFGRAPFFTVVDLEGGEVEVVRNPGCRQKQHQLHHIHQLKGHRVDAVVCSGIGRRAWAALAEAGIEVLDGPGKTVAERVEAVRSGAAHPMTERDSCGGPHGHQHHRRHGPA